jgi:site-specific DNA recombinase
MNKEEIRSLIETLGTTRAVLADATPEDKAQVYHQLGLHLTYEPATRLVRGLSS